MQENNTTISNSMKSIVNAVEDLRQTLRGVEVRVKSLEYGLDKLEAELERQLLVQDKASREIQKLKNELEPIQASILSIKQANEQANKQANEQTNTSADTPQKPDPGTDRQANKKRKREANVPMMPGSGFSHVTLDYLRRLGNK